MTDVMKMKFILARYQESMEWASSIPDGIIYNKGPELSHSLPVIPLSNVGREGHTYAYHIVQNYDCLDDYTCFLQGNPFDHTPSLEQALQLAFQYIELHPEPFYFLSEHILSIDLSNDPTCPELVPVLQETYETLFGTRKTHHPFRFGPGAQFVVSKAAILARPKSFYEKIVSLLEPSVNPIEGFALERFWWMIFTGAE